jgi:hypothetical protein
MKFTIAIAALLATAGSATAQHLPSYGIATPARPTQRDMVMQGANGQREIVEIDRNATDAEVAAIVADARRRMTQRQ